MQLANRCQRIELGLKQTSWSEIEQDQNAKQKTTQKNNNRNNRPVVDSLTTSAAPHVATRNMTLVEKDLEQGLTSAKVVAGGYNKLLIISSSLLPGDLFTDEALVIPCTLGNGSKNEISTRSLLDTGATGVAFIDKAMARHVFDVLKISILPLARPKPLKSFDGKPARPITYAIYPTLTVQGHSELLASMLVTSLGQHPIILGNPWMQKHGVILDMSCDKLTFWPGHCQHSGARKSKDESLALPVKEPIRKEQLANNTPKYVIPANRKAAAPHAAPKVAAPQPSEAN